jgi:hypothetical protein
MQFSDCHFDADIFVRGAVIELVQWSWAFLMRYELDGMLLQDEDNAIRCTVSDTYRISKQSFWALSISRCFLSIVVPSWICLLKSLNNRCGWVDDKKAGAAWKYKSSPSGKYPNRIIPWSSEMQKATKRQTEPYSTSADAGETRTATSFIFCSFSHVHKWIERHAFWSCAPKYEMSFNGYPTERQIKIVVCNSIKEGGAIEQTTIWQVILSLLPTPSVPSNWSDLLPIVWVGSPWYPGAQQA